MASIVRNLYYNSQHYTQNGLAHFLGSTVFVFGHCIACHEIGNMVTPELYSIFIIKVQSISFEHIIDKGKQFSYGVKGGKFIPATLVAKTTPSSFCAVDR